MPREKPFLSKGVQVPDMAIMNKQTDMDQKDTQSAKKVTLVKPAQTEVAADIEETKHGIRPKVGRTLNTRQKPNENDEMNVPKTETVSQHKVSQDINLTSATSWRSEHARPWSFRSILICVALFVLINIGFMALFNANRAPSNMPTQVKMELPAAVGEDTLPPLEATAPLPPVTSVGAVMPVPAIAVTPQATMVATSTVQTVAQVVAPSKTEPSPQEKEEQQKTLLSILNKN